MIKKGIVKQYIGENKDLNKGNNNNNKPHKPTKYISFTGNSAITNKNKFLKKGSQTFKHQI